MEFLYLFLSCKDPFLVTSFSFSLFVFLSLKFSRIFAQKLHFCRRPWMNNHALPSRYKFCCYYLLLSKNALIFGLNVRKQPTHLQRFFCNTLPQIFASLLPGSIECHRLCTQYVCLTKRRCRALVLRFLVVTKKVLNGSFYQNLANQIRIIKILKSFVLMTR